MSPSVYKSEKGRILVEAYYRKALDSYGPEPLRRRMLPTPFGATHVIEYGDATKPPLVLLHGSLSNSASWLGILPEFAGSFSLYCVDIPGEPGLSEPERMPLAPGLSASEPGAPAAWLGAVLNGLGLDAAAFIGMSLGSFYALSLASAYPERAVALSLITTAGVAPQRKDFLFKALFCMLLGAPGQKLLNRLVYHKASVDPRILEFQTLVSANFNPLTEVIPLFGDDELKRLTMPVQYFGGDRDALIGTTKTAARLAILCPKAEIHVLHDTGHVIIDQWPAVKAFLASCCPPER
ncbi:MAG: alpha/beta fold hydrolase [Spirochaetes bacterium]|nr:alpha/beta fold hydrolase [Spirochaetota bacterium]